MDGRIVFKIDGNVLMRTWTFKRNGEGRVKVMSCSQRRQCITVANGSSCQLVKSEILGTYANVQFW